MATFTDYHRTVIGYHGTRRDIALEIVQGNRGFKPSKNGDDWLGSGVYFWEYAPQQAWEWAKRRYKRRRVAVLGAMIRLGGCLDLLDPANFRILLRFHREMLKAYEAEGTTPPRNFNASKPLDFATFEYGYAALEQAGEPVDTCRAVYVPTGGKSRLWERSWLYHETHIQLCVRNETCILGCWLVQPSEE